MFYYVILSDTSPRRNRANLFSRVQIRLGNILVKCAVFVFAQEGMRNLKGEASLADSSGI